MVATVIVASIVAAVFIAIIAVSVVNKKKGTSCSCGCGGCANREFCHPVKAEKEKTDK